MCVTALTCHQCLTDGIYELRAKHIRVQYRILYFFYGQNVAILAHAITRIRRGSTSN
ncbi:MAG: type II toxin-antitoxin system RelE/ParE family toxin [Gloeocapsa sp. UFS-A4-WI-NPMV-4B04]|nr:type II toxin-antitoxin system RelE/ParE family toxin [Gloeocapsa sp. UFS-A4-WI-NPMV-4B04]